MLWIERGTGCVATMHAMFIDARLMALIVHTGLAIVVLEA
jgi:hypothetical protein